MQDVYGRWWQVARISKYKYKYKQLNTIWLVPLVLVIKIREVYVLVDEMMRYVDYYVIFAYELMHLKKKL